MHLWNLSDYFFAVYFGIFGVIFWVFLGLRVPWVSFWQAFWVPGGPWETILAPKVSFGGSEGPSWTAGGSRGGSMMKKSLFPLHFGTILASKITQKLELKFD